VTNFTKCKLINWIGFNSAAVAAAIVAHPRVAAVVML